MFKWFLNRLFSWTWYFRLTGYKQVKITVVRVDANDKGLFGHLTTDNGFDCVTLERHDIAIPCGTYKVTMYYSPSHGCMVPLVNDVPKRSMIEIHWGNYEKDSKGCILVGSKRDGFAIDNSRMAFDGLMTHLKGANDIWLTIK